MATRTPGASTSFPTGQTRQQYQRNWGNYVSSATLPNAAGNILTTAQFKLEAGDVAYVATSATTGDQWLCVDAGTAGGGDAVWVMFSAGQTDRFAPKYLVGIEPNDSAAAYASDGFFYFSDPGDGTGLEAALLAAAGDPGDVWVRPGTIILDSAAVALPLAVPASVTLRGSGRTTRIITPGAAGDILNAFDLSGECTLADMVIESSITAPADDGGSNGVVTVGSGPEDSQPTIIRNVVFEFTFDPAAAAAVTLRSPVFLGGSGARVLAEKCKFTVAGDVTPLTAADAICAIRTVANSSIFVDGGTYVCSNAAVVCIGNGRLSISGSAEMEGQLGVAKNGLGELYIGANVRIVATITGVQAVISGGEFGPRMIRIHGTVEVDQCTPGTIGIQSEAQTGQVTGAFVRGRVAIDSSGGEELNVTGCTLVTDPTQPGAAFFIAAAGDNYANNIPVTFGCA